MRISFAILGLMLLPAASVMPEQPLKLTPMPSLSLAGEALYSNHCARCHGDDLGGAVNWRTPNADGTRKPRPLNVLGMTWRRPDVDLIAYIKLGSAGIFGDESYGTGAMPAFQNVLSEAEIGAVLDYIKSTWPEGVRESQARLNGRS